MGLLFKYSTLPPPYVDRHTLGVHQNIYKLHESKFRLRYLPRRKRIHKVGIYVYIGIVITVYNIQRSPFRMFKIINFEHALSSLMHNIITSGPVMKWNHLNKNKTCFVHWTRIRQITIYWNVQEFSALLDGKSNDVQYTIS